MVYFALLQGGDQISNISECKQCRCDADTKQWICFKHCFIHSCPHGQYLDNDPSEPCCKCVPIPTTTAQPTTTVTTTPPIIVTTTRTTTVTTTRSTAPPCPENKTRIECGCPQKCPNIETEEDKKCTSKDCQHMVCGCTGDTYDNGTHCVKKEDCKCDPKPTPDKCHVCKCVNGVSVCGKTCKITSCPSGWELIDPPDRCCECRPKSTTALPTTLSPTTPGTTQCPGVCICEKSCATVTNNPMGCDSFRCIKDCHCPRGYKRDNAARVCVPILECTTTQTPTTTTQSTTPGTSTFLPQFFLKLSFKKVTFSHS